MKRLIAELKVHPVPEGAPVLPSYRDRGVAPPPPETDEEANVNTLQPPEYWRYASRLQVENSFGMTCADMHGQTYDMVAFSPCGRRIFAHQDRKSTRLTSSH